MTKEGIATLVSLVLIAVICCWYYQRSMRELQKKESKDWAERQRELRAHWSEVEAAEARLKQDYGITVHHSHVPDAMKNRTGVSRLTEMGDGTLRDVLLRGEDLTPYVKDGEAWVPLAMLPKAAGQEVA